MQHHRKFDCPKNILLAHYIGLVAPKNGWVSTDALRKFEPIKRLYQNATYSYPALLNALQHMHKLGWLLKAGSPPRCYKWKLTPKAKEQSALLTTAPGKGSRVTLTFPVSKEAYLKMIQIRLALGHTRQIYSLFDAMNTVFDYFHRALVNEDLKKELINPITGKS